jgi:parvulin-like peptidyl-prolyl isomerase
MMRHHIKFPNVRPCLVLAVALCTLHLIFCSACASTQPSSNTETASLPAVVATVNGREIPTKLYEMYLKNGREELGLNPNTEEGRKKIEQLGEGIVSEMIDRTLIMHEAERRGLSNMTDKLAAAERRTITQFGGDQKYDAYLASHRLTRDEYREVIKMEAYGELLRAELAKGLEVKDEEIKTFYEAHKRDAEFQLPERVTASHILIAARPNVIAQQLQREKQVSGEALKKLADEEIARRRARAEELKRKARAGADFAQLARQHSDDPSSREKGGDLGSFTRNSHPRAFDDAAFALKPGTVGEVVETDYGYHVIKVFAHDQPRAQTLAEATPEIRRRLLAEREARNLTDWLKETRRKAQVRINEPFRFGALKDEFPST